MKANPIEDEADRLRRCPAPFGGLADRQQHRRDPNRHQGSGEPVDPARDADRGFGDEFPGEDPGGDDRDQRYPEQPVVVEVLDDHAREHDSGAAADTEDRREQSDPAGHLLGRELVADDAEGEREDSAGDPLDDPGPDQHRQRGGDRRQQGAEGEDREGPEQQLLLAVHVAETAEDRGPDRGGEEVAGEQPGDPGLGACRAPSPSSAGPEPPASSASRRRARRAPARPG